MFALFKSITPSLAVAVVAACAATPLTPIQSTPVVPAVLATIAPTAASNPSVTAAPAATPISTLTPFPMVTSAPTPIPVVPVAIDDTWSIYTNAKYGFSFRYPSDWTLKEIVGTVNTMSGHAVHLINPNVPAVRMIVAFKHATEDKRIAPTGMGDGELISRGSVSLLDQQIERIARVSLEKDMAVYYGWPPSAAAGADLVFWLALDCACSAGDPAVTGLTAEMEQIADAFVESIEVKK